ncbi:MAG: amidohydrolase family protein [Terrimesophilobacter sp.]
MSVGATVVFIAEHCWLGGWREQTRIAVDDNGFRLATGSDPYPKGTVQGTVLPGFRDSHVHLGLADGAQLRDAGIAAVHDFGWDLKSARAWLVDDALPEVTIAGQLLTAPGGYPTESGWAPHEAAFEIAGPDEVAAAVDTQLDAGAGFIKVALNSDVGPVFDDETLKAIVTYAHGKKLYVAAHAQGVGQAQRALEAGVDRLAHAPWSERLSEELIAEMVGAMSWVSTLDIHGWGNFTADFAVANDNVRRFHAAGGRIHYGTDMGNGPIPLGINHRELVALEHAGLDLNALVDAIARPVKKGHFGKYLSLITGDQRDVPADWIASAHLISPTSVKAYLS